MTKISGRAAGVSGFARTPRDAKPRRGVSYEAPPLIKHIPKIGIFSGTFDPVHAGHIAFALEAAARAGLDKIYFIPERQPRRKHSVTHHAHRVAMLKLALRPYDHLQVLELPDKQLSVSSTLPKLRKRFAGAELHQLIGTDLLDLLASEDAKKHWKGLDIYLNEVTLIVGLRSEGDVKATQQQLDKVQPRALLVSTASDHITSSVIRHAVMRGKKPDELLPSLRRYVSKHWLYTSIDGVAANSSL